MQNVCYLCTNLFDFLTNYIYLCMRKKKNSENIGVSWTYVHVGVSWTCWTSSYRQNPAANYQKIIIFSQHILLVIANLELAVRQNWSTRQESWPWPGSWPRTQWPLWHNYRVPWLRWENLPEGQQSLQHFTNPGFMGEWPDGSHMTACLEFAKRHVNDSDNEAKDSVIWWDEG